MQLRYLEKQCALNPTASNLREAARLAEVALGKEGTLLTAIVEESERNLLMVMNAFARVAKLAQAVFELPFDLSAAVAGKLRPVNGRPPPSRAAGAASVLSPTAPGPGLAISDDTEGTFGLLPRVFGYGVKQEATLPTLGASFRLPSLVADADDVQGWDTLKIVSTTGSPSSSVKRKPKARVRVVFAVNECVQYQLTVEVCVCVQSGNGRPPTVNSPTAPSIQVNKNLHGFLAGTGCALHF